MAGGGDDGDRFMNGPRAGMFCFDFRFSLSLFFFIPAAAGGWVGD